MSGKNFDIFISYRRSDGADKARMINLAFKNEGYRCFLDYNSLVGGTFEERIEAAIEDAPVFVMILTPDYFVRCNQKDDWVRREIELALDRGKKIIPINIDNELKGVPDYLDEKFRERVGCHNFATVYSNDAFEASFNDMLEKRIRKVVGSLQKQTDKAKITIATDADCRLMKNNEVLATLQANEHSLILLGKGNHLLQARSDEFPEISVNIIKKVEDVSCDDFIIIELANKLQPLREEKRRQPSEETARQQNDENTFYDVFISYSTEDKKLVEAMCHYLEERNLRCFVAYRDVPYGEDWGPYIERGIEDAKVFVYVHTEASNKSIETTREINLAFKEGCVVFPFRVDPIEYGKGKKYRLNNVNWLDAFPQSPESYFGELFDFLKVHFPERV